MNGGEDTVEKARELVTNLVQQQLSSMTLCELYYVVARATDSEAEREKIEQSSSRNQSTQPIRQSCGKQVVVLAR